MGPCGRRRHCCRPHVPKRRLLNLVGDIRGLEAVDNFRGSDYAYENLSVFSTDGTQAQRGGSYGYEKCLLTVSAVLLPMPGRGRCVIPTAPSRHGKKNDGHCGKTVFRNVSTRNVIPSCPHAFSGTVGAAKYYLPTVPKEAWEEEGLKLWQDTLRSRSCPRRERPRAWSDRTPSTRACSSAGGAAPGCSTALRSMNTWRKKRLSGAFSTIDDLMANAEEDERKTFSAPASPAEARVCLKCNLHR